MTHGFIVPDLTRRHWATLVRDLSITHASNVSVSADQKRELRAKLRDGRGGGRKRTVEMPALVAAHLPLPTATTLELAPSMPRHPLIAAPALLVLDPTQRVTKYEWEHLVRDLANAVALQSSAAAKIAFTCRSMV